VHTKFEAVAPDIPTEGMTIVNYSIPQRLGTEIQLSYPFHPSYILNDGEFKIKVHDCMSNTKHHFLLLKYRNVAYRPLFLQRPQNEQSFPLLISFSRNILTNVSIFLRLLLGHNSMNIRLLIDVSSFYLCIVSLP
jgi:hypothetical protein